MVNKKNKYTRSQNNRNNDPAPVIDEEGLMTECLELHQLLKNRTAKLRELKETDLCYLISTKWLQDWKQYVGYSQLVGDEDEKSTKKDKKYGKRHPGKINSDIIASGNQARQMYTIPKQLQSYQYLNQVTDQKKEKDSDYIAITEQIWLTFLRFYEGEQVRRPIRPMKGSTYYDGEPLRCDVILANLEDQEIQQRIKKTNKKNYNSVFQSNKFMLSTTWTIKQLYDFLSQYCGIVFGISKIRIWKGFGYLATNPIAQALVQSIKERKFSIKGRQLTKQRYQDKDIDDYLKISHTLIVQIGQLLKTDTSQDEQLKGYCEECVEKKTLSIACICNEVIYCSRKCRTADQTFHFKTCSQAFDSEDDEEYEKKQVVQLPLSGFQNIGNTCYMNSTIQSIVSIDIIRNFFVSNEYLKHLNEKEQKENKCMFLRKLSKTFKTLAEQIDNYAPWSLKSQIDYNLPPFKGDKQHDANDFFINFLNTLNDYLSKHADKAYHSILQPFVGQFYSNVVCPHCKGESQNNQIFLQISLPIKSKPTQKTFQYTVVESLNKVRRGKTSLGESWHEIKKSINAKNAIACVSKQPMGLSLINQQQESPQKSLKNIKGDVIFLLDIQRNQGQAPFVINLITFKDIAGNSMKSSYGIPSLIFVNDLIISLGLFWLQTIRKYFSHNEEYVAQSLSIQKEYLEEIQKAVKEDAIEQSQKKTETKEEAQGIEKQSQKCKAIAEFFKKRIEIFASKVGIKIYIVDFKRNRNLCKFCKKKCSGCELPKTIDEPFHQFFEQKYNQVRFEVYLQDYLNIDYVNQDMGITSDPNIQNCLQLFTEPQELDEENAWYCQNCDSMALALKELQVKKFPSILILHLNRFKTVDHKKIKNNDPIQYGQIQSFGGKQYRLLSVIIHQGSMDAGHYWSISLRGDNYYIFNDAKVSKVQKVFHKNAYILIYQDISFKP